MTVRLTPEILVHVLQIQAGDYEIVEPTQDEIDAFLMTDWSEGAE